MVVIWTPVIKTKNVVTIAIYCACLCLFKVNGVICNNSSNVIHVMSSAMTRLHLNSDNVTSNAGNSSSDCRWLLDSGSDDEHLLIFIAYNISCYTDKIYIHNGKDNTDAMLANGLCGTPSTTSSYSTSQRYAFIQIRKGSSSRYLDMTLDVISAKDYSGSGCHTPQVITSTDTYRFLSSPRFPDRYSSDVFCRWTLINPEGQVFVDVLLSDVEDGDPMSCFDQYMIYDGRNRCENNNITMVCSEYPAILPYNVTSSGSALTITFQSDTSVSKRGFLLRFKSLVKPKHTTYKPKITPKTTFRVWNSNNTESKLILAGDFNELQTKVVNQFSLSTPSCPIRIVQDREIADEVNFQYVVTDFINLRYVIECVEPLTSDLSTTDETSPHSLDVTGTRSTECALNNQALLGLILGILVLISIIVIIILIIIRKFQRTNAVSKTKVEPFLKNTQKKTSVDWVTIRQHDHVIIENTGITPPGTVEGKSQRKLSMW